MHLCHNCHQALEASAEFCEHCGALAEAAQPPMQPGQTVVSPTCPRCRAPRRAQARFCNSCGYSFVPLEPAEAPPPAGSLPAGSVLGGKYRLSRAIGAGGMGAVYLAEDQVLKRPVVIKTLVSSGDPDLAAQSVKEREFLAALKHASIVSIYDCFTIGADGYIVMEYVQGRTLQQLVEAQGGPLGVADAIRYLLAILPAFSYLAKLELVYCDFKPQNVMLERLRDGSEVVKLIDLGTVIRATPHPDSVYGTPGFFAPEAVRAPSHETDLYSICRALAYLVSLMDLEEPPFGMPPAERYPVFGGHPLLYRLLCRGTHPDPARRFHSAEELGEQLAGVLRLTAGGEPGLPAPSGLFTSGVTATERLAPRGEAALDERDPSIELLRQGDRALRLGNYRAARAAFGEAARRNPRSGDAHGRLVEVAIELGALPDAEAALDQARLAGLSGWKLAWYAGRLAEAAGDSGRAERAYQAVVDELPGELPPQQALARIRAQAGDDPEAVSLYTRVLRADPGNSEAILGMTGALLRLKRWAEVAQVLSGVSEAAARYVDAQLLLCDLFLNRITPLNAQNIERAAQAVNALAGRTEDPRYYLACGDVYRAALLLVRAGKLPADFALPGLPRVDARTLGHAAEASYVRYLRAAQNPADREAVVRRRFAVAPWRLY